MRQLSRYGWRPADPPRRPVLFVNPRSGDGKAARAGLADRARETGIETIILAPGQDLAALAGEAAAAGADALGIAGGDGSLAVVATVAAAHGIPFVCVPAGTRNHFALERVAERHRGADRRAAGHLGDLPSGPVFDRSEPYRVWPGIAGLLLVVIGVILIRHLNLTVALVGLVIGVTWIVQGLASLVTAFSGGTAERRGWWIFFGLIGLIAGIVVVAVPTTSVTVLAVLVGIWFIAEGLVEIVGGFMQRHAASKSQASDGQPAPSW